MKWEKTVQGSSMKGYGMISSVKSSWTTSVRRNWSPVRTPCFLFLSAPQASRKWCPYIVPHLFPQQDRLDHSNALKGGLRWAARHPPCGPGPLTQHMESPYGGSKGTILKWARMSLQCLRDASKVNPVQLYQQVQYSRAITGGGLLFFKVTTDLYIKIFLCFLKIHFIKLYSMCNWISECIFHYASL